MQKGKYLTPATAPFGAILRTRPDIYAGTVTIMKAGEKGNIYDNPDIRPVPPEGWVMVNVHRAGIGEVYGYVKADKIQKIKAKPNEILNGLIPAVHLHTKKDIYPSGRSGRAFPLSVSKDSKVREWPIAKMLNWLDVEKNGRYRPTKTKTFCNIYAYDLTFLNGVYLPRVWWQPSTLPSLRKGRPVAVEYGVTVREMNANNLYLWLVEHGPVFGWECVETADDFQNRVNAGAVGVISASHKIGRKSGHITVGLPDGTEGEWSMCLSTTGKVIHPLQTQAGRRNRRIFTHYTTASGEALNWWTGAAYAESGFFVNDSNNKIA